MFPYMQFCRIWMSGQRVHTSEIYFFIRLIHLRRSERTSTLGWGQWNSHEDVCSQILADDGITVQTADPVVEYLEL